MSAERIVDLCERHVSSYFREWHDADNRIAAPDKCRFEKLIGLDLVGHTYTIHANGNVCNRLSAAIIRHPGEGRGPAPSWRSGPRVQGGQTPAFAGVTGKSKAAV